MTEMTENPLDEKCGLCEVPIGTGICHHLLYLRDGRVLIAKSDWEKLLNEQHGDSDDFATLVEVINILTTRLIES